MTRQNLTAASLWAALVGTSMAALYIATSVLDKDSDLLSFVSMIVGAVASIAAAKSAIALFRALFSR